MDRLCKLLTRFSLAASIDTSHWEFPDVCQYYFGSFGRWSSLLFSLVSLVGAMIVYWVLMSNFFFNTGKFIYNYVHHVNVTEIGLSTNGSDRVICPDTEDPPPSNHTVGLSAGNTTGLLQFEEWWSKTNTVPLYLIVVLLPLLNFRSPSFFAKFNVLGTASVLYLVCLVTYKAVRIGFHFDFHWDKAQEYFLPEFRLSFPQLSGILTLAFFIHNCIITLLKNNQKPENNCPLASKLAVRIFLLGVTHTATLFHSPVPPWDLNLVLDALQDHPFEPLARVPWRLLSWKVAFLVAVASQ
ncbi:hypothetical protein GDO78_022975 [Eleutherodactylus coqui]|uniref:Sodium-coupled neutral amino acid transporter 9 n=1 Tax=Eleutherodactylus coqui TaxID=57060 RepID=A0A8J6E7D2_ELECQ|nr:hypothetical protein GDO78_022975 [Eleutherodactylus coqui]